MQVFIVPLRVAPTQESILPPGSTSAFVACYAGGSGYEEAVQRCLAALAGDGLRPDEILQPINAMAASDWAAHVAEQWPDQAAGLPDQATFKTRIGRGEAMYGPFGTFSGA